MDGEFVQVGAFTHLIDADLARARLEWHGIECYAFDESVVAVNWLYSRAVGGIKLKVRRADAERAIEILREEPAKVEVRQEGVTENQPDILCPRCSSPDIFPERLSRRMVFATWIFLGVPLPFLSRKWKCIECDYKWKPG